MKYVVTGGAGFIGSHLVEELVRQHHEGRRVSPKKQISGLFDINIHGWLHSGKYLVTKKIFIGSFFMRYFIFQDNHSLTKSMAIITDETNIKKTYRDSVDTLLSLTLAKITRPATLEEVLSRIASHVSDAGDTTALITTLRNREYGS